MKNKAPFTIADVLNTLEESDRAAIFDFHQLGISLDCKELISIMGKTTDDWKCEYSIKKSKRTLFVVRASKKGWSIRCKLFNIAKYEDVAAACTERIKQAICSNPDCEMHGGRCKGGVQFSMDKDMYSKCRHYFLFQGLSEEDCNCIQTLLVHESKYEE